MALSDNDIIKCLGHCKTAQECYECDYQPSKQDRKGTVGCSLQLMNDALDLINRQKAEIEKLEYILMGVMHSVDKWLEGDELNHDETNRAVIMREKTLQIVEKQQAEIERLKNEVFAKEQEYVDMQEQRDSVEYNLELIKQEKSVVRAEAIKEFAERFMDECLAYPVNDGDLTILVSKRDFDNLVKEKTGTDFTQMFMGTDKLKPLPSIDVQEMVGDNDD